MKYIIKAVSIHFQNSRRNKTIYYKNKTNSDNILDNMEANTAELKDLIEQSRELLELTNEVKIQSIKIING